MQTQSPIGFILTIFIALEAELCASNGFTFQYIQFHRKYKIFAIKSITIVVIIQLNCFSYFRFEKSFSNGVWAWSFYSMYLNKVNKCELRMGYRVAVDRETEKKQLWAHWNKLNSVHNDHYYNHNHKDSRVTFYCKCGVNK